MQFNVSQLLKEPPGTERRYSFQEEERRFEELAADVHGAVRLMRGDQGILVMAEIETAVGCVCSRCLNRFVEPVSLQITEEFLPTLDVTSGARLSPADDGSFTIDAQHILDLGDAVRQYAVLAAPMKPLCAADCAGLCPTCGANFNQGQCGCPTTQADSRWAKLEGLGLRLGNT